MNAARLAWASSSAVGAGGSTGAGTSGAGATVVEVVLGTVSGTDVVGAIEVVVSITAEATVSVSDRVWASAAGTRTEADSTTAPATPICSARRFRVPRSGARVGRDWFWGVTTAPSMSADIGSGGDKFLQRGRRRNRNATFWSSFRHAIGHVTQGGSHSSWSQIGLRAGSRAPCHPPPVGRSVGPARAATTP